MEVAAPPAVTAHILHQLQEQNRTAAAFGQVFADYQTILRQSRELQVRCAQLDKEAGELRIENETLREAANLQRNDVVFKAQVAMAEDKARKVQDELNGVLRDKARLAEENLAAHRQLEVVRKTSEQQVKELGEASAKEKELKARVKGLAEQLETVTAAHNLATSEIQSHIQAKEQAEQQAAKLEGDFKEVTQRLIEEKSQHMNKVVETTRICEEMLEHARQMERASKAKLDAADRAAEQQRAQQQQQQPQPARGGPAGFLDRLSSVGRQQAQALNAAARRSSDVSSPRAAEEPVPIAATQLPERVMRTISAHAGGGFTLAFDKSGMRLASGGADELIRLWDPVDGRPTGSLEGMQETVTELAFTNDGSSSSHLLASGSDKAIRVFSLETSRVRHILTGHNARVYSVACSPSDPASAASSGQDRVVRLWDLRRGVNPNSKLFTSTVYSLRYNLDGSLVVSGHHDGALRFWDFRQRQLANEVAGLHTQQICSVSVGRRTGLVLTCGKDNCLRIVDARTFQVQQTLTSPGFSVATTWCTACLSSDESHVAAGSANGSVFVWEVGTGKVVRSLKEGGSQNVQASSWSPQGHPLVSMDKAGTMTLWHS